MKKLILPLIVALLVLALASCTLGGVVGSWKSETEILGFSAETVYTFEKDGNGRYSTLLGVDVDFTYTLEDGILTITTHALGLSNSTEYECSRDGDTLTLTKDGTSVTLTKVE
ncbi:MAG: hypothetical protein IJF34_06600 [Clostridia bacterium]|nr:hypothetical protein [Oscillospiraceae bacterium]MBQ2749434.1 hypothetical protein [Clostridia bacterium]MBQ4623433.1 hypothetical protein [Clostridia bacterium]